MNSKLQRLSIGVMGLAGMSYVAAPRIATILAGPNATDLVFAQAESNVLVYFTLPVGIVAAILWRIGKSR